MFRCRLPDGDLERLSGYGLAIKRGNIHFVRWEKGLSRAVGTGMAAPVLKGRAGVEVLVMLTGPLMAALILDIDTLEPLATLTANDARFSMGAIQSVVTFRRTVAFERVSANETLTDTATVSPLCSSLRTASAITRRLSSCGSSRYRWQASRATSMSIHLVHGALPAAQPGRMQWAAPTGLLAVSP